MGRGLQEEEPFAFKRDFLAVSVSSNWDDVDQTYLDPEGLAVQIRSFLPKLKAPTKRNGSWTLSQWRLIPDELPTVWTGHSARHTLPSWAAAVGVIKEERDFLGRWSCAKHGSNDYLLTSRQVVHGVQLKVCCALITGDPQPGVIEEELIERLK